MTLLKGTYGVWFSFAAVVALSTLLLLSSIRTLRDLDDQRTVFLRSRAAAVAGRLETLSEQGISPGATVEAIEADEPALVGLRILSRNETGGDDAQTEPIWQGRELFRAGYAEGGRTYLVWTPFHTAAGLRIARIELAAGAADFLVTHARHNVLFSVSGAVALVLLALYAVWSARRKAALEQQRLELEHLAHIGTMSAALAHEIRNPLGTIKGFVQLAHERADGGTAALLDPALAETMRLERLVNSLLLYGRPPTPVLREVAWDELEHTLAAHLGQMRPELAVRFLHNEAPTALKTDPDLLIQILLNLVRNAVEAAGEDGEVTLEICCRAGGLTLSVRDNGPGLPDSVLRNPFQPFRTTKASGAGLGLSIANRLTAALGGSLELRNLTPRGAEAALRFPGARCRAQAAGTS